MSNENRNAVTDFLKSVAKTKPMDVEGEKTEEVVTEEVPTFVSQANIRPKNLTHVKEIKLDYLDVEPLPAPKLNDKKGLFSERVTEFIQKHKVSVVPFAAVNLPDSIEELRDYSIVTVKGYKCAASVDSTLDRSAVIQYARSLRNSYQESAHVDVSIMESVTVDGTVYKIPKYNHYELSLINSVLKNYPFEAYEDINGDIRLAIGGVF